MPSNLLIQLSKVIIIYSIFVTIAIIITTIYLYPTKKLI